MYRFIAKYFLKSYYMYFLLQYFPIFIPIFFSTSRFFLLYHIALLDTAINFISNSLVDQWILSDSIVSDPETGAAGDHRGYHVRQVREDPRV